MNEKDAVALLREIHGSHSKAAISIGYTPEYYTSLRTALKHGNAIPSSARSRIVLEALVASEFSGSLSQERQAVSV